MKPTKCTQQGIGLFSLVSIIAVVLFIVILGIKLVPPYLHNMQVERIFNVIASDTEMTNASEKEIRASYSKRATMDYINDLTADNIEVNKDGGKITLSAEYTVKIPVAGNISFLLEFSPRTTIK